MSNTTISPAVAGVALAGGNVAPAVFAAMLGFAGISTQVWSLLGANAIGAPTPLQPWTCASFTATGTLGANGVLVIQGSNDGQTWQTLGAMSNLTTAGLGSFSSVAGDVTVTPLPNGKMIVGITDGSLAEPTRYLRPVIQSGDGTTNVAVTGKLSSVGAV